MSAVMARLWDEESGQGMVEYALVIAFIGLAVMSAIGAMGGELRTFFDGLTTKLAELTP